VPSLELLPALAPSTPPHQGWRALVTALLDLVFPAFCPVCRRRLGDGRRDPLCGGCWAALEPIIAPYCRVCGIPFQTFPTGDADRSVGRLCGPCRARSPLFSYARSAVRYEGVAREALHAFKFGARRALAAPLGDLVAGLGPEALPVSVPDLLVPVPLHVRRERERGFNQALLLAARVGRAWRVPVRSDVLVRTVPTVSQTDLSAEARRANVRRAFALRRPELVAGRHVLLVDDIYTTGSTVGECARCLEDGGAATVGVLTVARVI